MHGGRVLVICQSPLSVDAGRVPALALVQVTARGSCITVRRPHRPLHENYTAMVKRSRSNAVRFHLVTTAGLLVRGQGVAPVVSATSEGRARRGNYPFSREPVVVDCPKISNKFMEAPSLMQ